MGSYGNHFIILLLANYHINLVYSRLLFNSKQNSVLMFPFYEILKTIFLKFINDLTNDLEVTSLIMYLFWSQFHLRGAPLLNLFIGVGTLINCSIL